jgi:hypothetical protein
VDVQVRHRIAEQLVVHVARSEDVLDHPRDSVNVDPVRRDFCGGQACEVGDVTASKDDDRMTASDGVALKVCVADTPGVERLPKFVSAEPAAHPSFPGVPVLGPGSCHRRGPCGATSRLRVKDEILLGLVERVRSSDVVT